MWRWLIGLLQRRLSLIASERKGGQNVRRPIPENAAIQYATKRRWSVGRRRRRIRGASGCSNAKARHLSSATKLALVRNRDKKMLSFRVRHLCRKLKTLQSCKCRIRLRKDPERGLKLSYPFLIHPSIHPSIHPFPSFPVSFPPFSPVCIFPVHTNYHVRRHSVYLFIICTLCSVKYLCLVYTVLKTIGLHAEKLRSS